MKQPEEKRNKEIEFNKLVTVIGELYRVRIFSDNTVEPVTMELREDGNIYTGPLLFDALNILDFDRWASFLNMNRIKSIDKRKKSIKVKKELGL